MAELGDTVEELQDKLAQYREQLKGVEQALEDQPDEPALLKLRSDFNEVISLTEDLVKFQQSNSLATLTQAKDIAVVDASGIATVKAPPPSLSKSSRSSSASSSFNAGRVRATQAQAAAISASINRKVKEIVTPGGYRIPEFLTIKDTDTETQKHNKRRKIQQIKKQQRQEQLETEATARATSWRKFASKASNNKKVKGFLTGKKRESIFKSTDDKPADQVAAKGFLPRRKYDFDGDLGDD